VRVVLPVLLLVALAAALIARAGSASSPVAFRTPDAGAACRARGEAIVCSTLASRQSARLRANGGAELVQRLPWWDASTPVLRRWRHGTLTCTLVRSALICGNGRTSIRVAADGLAVAG
jgi:hypothetical protein